MQRLQDGLGYRFNEPDLLRSALVHRSYANEQRKASSAGTSGRNPARQRATNERLEFLGDAVLTFVVADRLYNRYPRASEGELTRARANLVNKRTLAEVARTLELGEAVLMGKGARAEGGPRLDSILADTFEAVLGATYLDGGVAACQTVVDRCLLERVLPEGEWRSEKDAKSRLQEITQARHKVAPTYIVLSGPPAEEFFHVEALLNGSSLGAGQGASKGEAEQAAAAQALQNLQSAAL